MSLAAPLMAELIPFFALVRAKLPTLPFFSLSGGQAVLPKEGPTAAHPLRAGGFTFGPCRVAGRNRRSARPQSPILSLLISPRLRSSTGRRYHLPVSSGRSWRPPPF